MSISRSIFFALLFCKRKNRLNEFDLQQKPLISSKNLGYQISARLEKSCSIFVYKAERANLANTSSYLGLNSFFCFIRDTSFSDYFFIILLDRWKTDVD